VQGVLQFAAIKIEPTDIILVKELAAAVAQQLVNSDLELKGCRFPLLEQLAVSFAAKRVTRCIICNEHSIQNQPDECDLFVCTLG
jgi:hypothetical protein